MKSLLTFYSFVILLSACSSGSKCAQPTDDYILFAAENLHALARVIVNEEQEDQRKELSKLIFGQILYIRMLSSVQNRTPSKALQSLCVVMYNNSTILSKIVLNSSQYKELADYLSVPLPEFEGRQIEVRNGENIDTCKQNL